MKPRPEEQSPCHSSFSAGIICGPHRGSFAVRDHLRFNLGIISGLGIICGRESYMIQCTKCRIQYIGETQRRLTDRFGEHRRAVEKAITQRDINQPTAVSDHFTLHGHSLNNLELIPLELINSNSVECKLGS